MTIVGDVVTHYSARMTHATPRPATGLQRWIKEPFCGLSHLLGAVLGAVGLVVLLTHASGDFVQRVGLVVYGASLITLFLASAVAHSVHCSTEVETRLNRLDYAAIFFLIAGTYTPICLGVLRGPWGTTMLVIEWTLAVFGATLVLMGRGGRVGPMLLYIPMGWLVLIATGPMLRLMPTDALVWLLVGGAIYSLGAIVFATHRPRLWPGVFSAHDLWHTMVLVASACQFIAIYLTL